MAKVCKIQPPLVCNLRSPPTSGAPRECRGAEADQGESEHVRAHGCASCAAALIRRAPQGTGRAGCAAGADAGWFSLGYFSHQTPDLVASPTLLLRRQQYGSPQLHRLALQCLQLAVPPLQLEGTDPALYVRLSLGQQRIDPTR